ncbi:MAG: hypothetical protein SAK29_27470 [Scytonema sp. PMC 1069.18]|nr:hypothetical protein [Scytonema sp. PMC 1069.18]MEC4885102.1 hypothetical protein [Scytonema sp. PMC 1070.18]
MSAHNYRLIASCSQLHSVEFRVYSVWADKELHLSLMSGTFTHIRPKVQPLMTVICRQVGWLMYGLVTVIQSPTNRTSFPQEPTMSSELGKYSEVANY